MTTKVPALSGDSADFDLDNEDLDFDDEDTDWGDL